MSRIIVITSGKGGVGKTVTVANLAAALALAYDKKILAVDTNVSTASLGMHFDIFYPEHTIHDISGKHSENHKSIHVYHQNLHIIPASIKVRSDFKDPKNIQKNLLNLTKNYEEFLDKISEVCEMAWEEKMKIDDLMKVVKKFYLAIALDNSESNKKAAITLGVAPTSLPNMKKSLGIEM